MHLLESCLKEVGEIRPTGGGVPEESYCGALEELLNEVGNKLKPRVRCVRQVMDTGAGHPHFGLCTAEQSQRGKDREAISGQVPERGVIEVKPTGGDSWLAARGRPLTRYRGCYGQVLVTNYGHLLLMGRDEGGEPQTLETFRAWLSIVQAPAPRAGSRPNGT